MREYHCDCSGLFVCVLGRCDDRSILTPPVSPSRPPLSIPQQAQFLRRGIVLVATDVLKDEAVQLYRDFGAAKAFAYTSDMLVTVCKSMIFFKNSTLCYKIFAN